MKRLERFLSFTQCSLSIGIAAALAASISVARADTWDKKTTVSFSQPVEVPGAILQPGKYVMKLVDSQSDRHVVQFMNERQNRVYASAIAVPAYRTQATDRTVITFYEAGAGQPEPIRNWYYPGDNFGQEFVYSKQHLRDIAATIPPATPPAFDTRRQTDSTPVATAEPVPDTASAPVAAATEPPAQDSQVTDADQSSAPVEIAQAAPQKPDDSAAAPSQTAPAPAELPQTSGNFAGIALLGLVSIGGAVTARKLRRF